MNSRRHLALNFLPWIAILLSIGVASACWQAGFFHSLDSSILKRYQKLEPAFRDNLPIELVTIQKTGEQSWPWSSLDYAILLNALGPFSPSVIALDLPLGEGDPLYPIYDIQLANQMARFHSVVVSQSSSLPSAAPLASAATLAPSRLEQSPTRAPEHLPLAFRQDDAWQPSFALQIVGNHLKADWSRSSFQPGHFIILRDSKSKILLKVPVDNECRMLVHRSIFNTKPVATDFYSAIISAEDLRNGGTGSGTFHDLRGKIILVGPEAPGTYREVKGTSGSLPPVYLHYHTIAQLLSLRFISGMNDIFYLLFLISACLMAGAFALIPSRLASISLLLVYLAACLIASYLSYDMARIWWPLLPILGGALLSWISARCLNLLAQAESTDQPELFSEF